MGRTPPCARLHSYTEQAFGNFTFRAAAAAVVRQHCRLSICENWLSWTNTVSEQKIPITILILKRGPCLVFAVTGHLHKTTD